MLFCGLPMGLSAHTQFFLLIISPDDNSHAVCLFPPDMDFDSGCLHGIVNNGNAYESRVLKNYLESKGLTIKELLESCCQKLDDGTYHCSDSRSSRMSSTTRTCYTCALKNFKDLVYLYRKEIPDDELPGKRY